MTTNLDRREFLTRGSAAAVALALAGVAAAADDVTTSSTGGTGPSGKPSENHPEPEGTGDATSLRIGLIGCGPRGMDLLRGLLRYPEIEIPAICDINVEHLNQGLDAVEKARRKRPEGFSKGPTDYRHLLEHAMDAVVIATPPPLHAQMAIDSMRVGKFVGSEVPACVTLEECWALLEAQRKTRGGYMMLENYIYTEPAMQVLAMAQKGAFGDLTYAEGSYIHEVRNLKFNKDGSLTWRGEATAKNHGNVYPTHAMGPVCRWLGINEDDRLVSLVAMDSKSAASHEYAVKIFGEGSPAAKVHFAGGDVSQTLIRTEKGRMIEIRYDTSSPRPPGQGKYLLQGSHGAFESCFGQNQVYMEGSNAKAEEWEDLAKYAAEFQHPLWKERGVQARASGHGGGDYFVISDFLQAVRTGKSAVSLVDAVTWSAVRPLSRESVVSGSKPVKVPDFRG